MSSCEGLEWTCCARRNWKESGRKFKENLSELRHRGSFAVLRVSQAWWFESVGGWTAARADRC